MILRCLAEAKRQAHVKNKTTSWLKNLVSLCIHVGFPGPQVSLNVGREPVEQLGNCAASVVEKNKIGFQ